MSIILNIKDHNAYMLLTHIFLGYLGSSTILNYNVLFEARN